VTDRRTDILLAISQDVCGPCKDVICEAEYTHADICTYVSYSNAQLSAIYTIISFVSVLCTASDELILMPVVLRGPTGSRTNYALIG